MATPVPWSRVVKKRDNVLLVATGPSVEIIPNNFYIDAIKSGIYVIAVKSAVQWISACHAFVSVDTGNRYRKLIANRRPGVLYYSAVPEDFGNPLAEKIFHRGPVHQGVKYLHRTCIEGHPLSDDPECIETGNSCYGALNITLHMEAKKVAIAGLDGTYQRLAFDKEGERPNGDLSHLDEMFNVGYNQMLERGAQIRNLSSTSQVKCIPYLSWRDTLAWFSSR